MPFVKDIGTEIPRSTGITAWGEGCERTNGGAGRGTVQERCYSIGEARGTHLLPSRSAYPPVIHAAVFQPSSDRSSVECIVGVWNIKLVCVLAEFPLLGSSKRRQKIGFVALVGCFTKIHS